jgi:four helix bundle protein
VQDIRRIKAWQRAHALAIALQKRSRVFSRLGYTRLRSQLTNAADSIGDTIMEGAGAASPREFARFLDMSIKSANETEGHLLKARDRAILARRVARLYGRGHRDPEDDLLLPPNHAGQRWKG